VPEIDGSQVEFRMNFGARWDQFENGDGRSRTGRASW